MESLALARCALRDASFVTVLTGAGISAESGLPTFRGKDGSWNGISAMDLASPEGFARDPRQVWEWYNLRRNALWKVRPNPAHFALAALERRAVGFGLITQNVDRLHQTAGSKKVVELHGNIAEVRCTQCAYRQDRAGIELPSEPKCPACNAWLRPGVVWFGEDLPHGAFIQAEEWTRQADVFMVVGTSAVVWPAAGLIYQAVDHGAVVIEVNLETTEASAVVTHSLLGKAGELLPALLALDAA
jgi:NAD-dependent deacetylase